MSKQSEMTIVCVPLASTLIRTNKDGRNNKGLIAITSKEEVKKAIAERRELFVIQRRISANTPSGITGYYNVRTNGALKEWKTRPLDWELPCKYGLKEYFRVSHRDTVDSSYGMLAIEAG